MTRKLKIMLASGFVACLTIILTISLAANPFAAPALPDFSAIEDVEARKTAFVDYLKPAIDELNRQRAEERQKLESFHKKLLAGKPPGWQEHRSLKAWARRYNIDFDPDQLVATAEKLLRHLDEIPASMVLAQAALESAWGTSRFVQSGNNFFGQWCFTENCGTVPNARAEDATHEVKNFSSAEAALQSYFRNINSHRAYEQVREIRAQAREAGQPLSGLEMVAGLEKYSERGQEYIEELRAVIRFNKFE